MLLFKKGTVMTYRVSGEPAYEKVDNEDWGWWRSLKYDLDKPLAERWGWKWTDEQVYNEYKDIAFFHTF